MMLYIRVIVSIMTPISSDIFLMSPIRSVRNGRF